MTLFFAWTFYTPKCQGLGVSATPYSRTLAMPLSKSYEILLTQFLMDRISQNCQSFSCVLTINCSKAQCPYLTRQIGLCREFL